MSKRFLSIWFKYLQTDWVSNRYPECKKVPFILSAPDHGRMMVTAVNIHAEQEGIYPGMVVADARAICVAIIVKDKIPRLTEKLLHSFAVWSIRFTPVAAIDPPDGIVLDISGCAHLWGGEEKYAQEIEHKLNKLGYAVRIGIADTIGAAWAVARFAKNNIIAPGHQKEAISSLPPAALRINQVMIGRLQKLGLKNIGQFIGMPASVLRRRFGDEIIIRLQQALGDVEEILQPVIPIAIYRERLPYLEPVSTATGIYIALEQLLELLCARLIRDGKGVRTITFTGYRVDHHQQSIKIGTHRASQNVKHLFKLLEEKVSSIDPGLGIELFTLEANKVEDIAPVQEKLWQNNYGLDSLPITELMDRLTNKLGSHTIHRYLPDEHYWPERSIKLAGGMAEKSSITFSMDTPRPLQLLPVPQSIMVAAPVPDYPPMLFRYRGKVHHIHKADGPERIEQEWWLQTGEHRDYYVVEDDQGARYWLFRQGHYDAGKNNQWFLHGYFA